MTRFLILVSLLYSFAINAQLSKQDSLIFLNQKLDLQIVDLLIEADSLGLDILLVRNYNPSPVNWWNGVRVMKEINDSCSANYIV